VASEPPGDDQWAAVALVVGPRGNRGEIETVLVSDHPERLARRSEVYLFDAADPEARHRRFEVERAWAHRGRFVFKLRGVDTISEAEKLRGSEVRVPLASRPPLPAGEYYQSDLVGFEVAERSSGERLGRVRGWQQYGGPPLLEIEADSGGEILIPFAGSICVQIDPDARRIVVELPEGLKELNR
jgi:16S rRNA processing protein RimM